MKYAFVLILLFGCDWWNSWYPADNFVEEIGEQIIENETGLDLDLSPNTPESAIRKSRTTDRKSRNTVELIK